MFALFAFTKHALEDRRLAGRWDVSPLMKLLIKDQMLYFVCYVVWQALDIPAASPGVSPPHTLIIVIDVLDALVVIAGPRMVISLRAAESQLIEGSFQTELSTIDFDARDRRTRMIGDGEPEPEDGLNRPRVKRETVEVGV
ncbi:hypothetical protein BV22DRAFT_76148 [Leucogyrophana mollusca]|uniref:Uncharacterized protein n=1 Tax=Leucogyrophana mollusca TaxID=85980 RepID=A0ACB8BWR5_9AGAM|nr:hypothetical protein BV22DRAFT_76148 [Leucogyrophana mollusca]